MKAIAMLLLTIGTIASSIALAPIPRMTRLFEQDLTAVASQVTKGVAALKDEALKKKAKELYKTTKLLGMTPERRMELTLVDLQTITERLGDRASMVEKVELAVKRAEATLEVHAEIAKAATEDDKKKLAPKLKKANGAASQRFEILERQLKENLDGAFPKDYADLHFVGKNTDDRRVALGADLEALGAILGPPGQPIIAQAKKSLATFDEQMKARKAADADRWGNPIWWLFALGCIAMFMGIALNRKLVRQAAEAEAAKVTEAGGDVGAYIHEITSSIGKLANTLDEVSDKDLHAELDRVIEGPLFDLIEGRVVLETVLGITDYAMAMSHLASAERGLNRAWCALTDEYPAEARVSVRTAHAALGRFTAQLGDRIGA